MRRRNRSLLALAVGALVTVAASLLVGAVPSSAANVPAAIKGYAFDPASMTISVGDTVTWTNEDKAPHTVTSTDGGPLDSPTLQQGDSWSFTFTKPGTYQYYCAIHPDMVGTVTVVAPTTAAPSTTEAPTTTTMAGMGGMGGGSGSTGGSPSPSPTPGCSSNGSVAAVLDPFMVHFDKAHLETSPGDQLGQAIDVDQYTKTHTVLVEQMLTPLVDIAEAEPGAAVSAFWLHAQRGHLEESPGQQAGDILNVDQYVKTHTVLIENMAAPAADQLAGSC